jgi:C4-dicarboxylate-specific signal transduction histidine kinase
MNITTDPNLWAISALVFLLGLLIGVFLTAGGRRKWKTRYREEQTRREQLESEHKQHVRDMEEREKEWRERDSLRAAAIKDPSEPGDGEIRSV